MLDARAGFTRAELVVVVVVLAVLAALLAPRLRGARPRAVEEARRIRCRNNLNQIAKGMVVYLSESGGSAWYPFPVGRGARQESFNGAEWLAALYWTGAHPDPGIFICPVSGDSNGDGADLGSRRAAATFGSQTVSYAGVPGRTPSDSNGPVTLEAIPADSPSNVPMASDDTQGDINHGTADNGGMAILFFDSHVEFRTNTEVDLETGVGSTEGEGLLKELRN